MNELSFIIINSKEPLAQLLYDELDHRVSFPVYQDTDDENIWNILQGGKDDMYVYDRCGRLTFHIPFPLSIIHPQQPIVNAAVQTTYHEKLCGESCIFTERDDDVISDYNSSLNNDHIHTNKSLNDTDILDIKDMKTTMEEKTINESNLTVIVEDVGDEFSDIFKIDEIVNNTTKWPNITSMENRNMTNENSESFWSWMFHFFSSDDSYEDNNQQFASMKENITTLHEYTTPIADLNSTVLVTTEENTTAILNENETFISEENITINNESLSEVTESISPNQCEEYQQTCSEWNKKKLLHAKKCCKNYEKLHNNLHNINHCKHFGSKRCKKLLPFLKCCLGTSDSTNKYITTESSTIENVTRTG